MVRVAAHPIRATALSMMAKGPTSPKEIAAAVSKPIGNVLYHVKALERGKMALLVDEKKRGGATEHFYIATHVTNEEAEALGPAERQKLAAKILQTIIADAVKALEEGKFGERSDSQVVRVPLYVDEEGWREISGIYAAAHEAALEAQTRCVQRLEASGKRGFSALAALLLFEMSGRPERD